MYSKAYTRAEPTILRKIGAFALVFLLALVTPSWATALVQCQGDNTQCSIAIYRSDAPTQLKMHPISVTEIQDDGVTVTINYDGAAFTTSCDGAWHNLGSAPAPEIQNKISCTVINSITIHASLSVYDQEVYNNPYPYTQRPSDTDPTLSGTSETSPYCTTDTSVASASACKWQKQNLGDPVLNARGIPLNDWVVYAKTNVTDLPLSTGSEGSSQYPFEQGEMVCMADINGDGDISQDEAATCEQSDDGQGYLCPLDATICLPTYSDPICPPGGSLNPDTDLCEATPDVTCPSGYTFNESFDTCTTPATCPGGGLLNPDTDLCEVVLTSDDCPSGYTYDPSLDACTKPITCPAGGVYNSSRDECEIAVSYTCPTGYTYNSSTGKCQANPDCPSGSYYDPAINLCVKPVTPACPSGYTYNSSRGVCERNPVCPSGSSYDTTLNLCTQSGTPTCPYGYTYNSSRGVCQMYPPCPSGGSYNGGYNECILAITPDCPSGYTYNSSRGVCERSPVCPSGGSYYGDPWHMCGTGASWYCSLNGQTYSDQSSCESACQTTGSCTVPNISVSCSYQDCGDSVDIKFNGYGDHIDLNHCNNCIHRFYLHGFTATGGGTTWPTCVVYAPLSASGNTITIGWATITLNGATATAIPNEAPWCEDCSPTTAQHIHCSGNKVWWTYSHSHDVAGGFEFYPSGYTCSLNGQNYPTLTDCQNNCTQSQGCTGQCPSGYSLQYISGVGWACTAGASCPSGGSLNTSTDLCETSPTMTCPSGYTYDSSIGYCTRPVYCPSGGTLNVNTDRCEVTPTPSCPSGWTYNYTYQVCTHSASCPSGGSLNTSTDKCEITPSMCESGWSYDSALNVCTHSASCPSGGVLNTSTDLCEITPSLDCPSGYTYSSSLQLCVASVNCSPGFFDSSLDLCMVAASDLCPTGYTFDSAQDKCTLEPQCPSGSTYSTTLNACTTDATHTCPSDYDYNSQTKVCESSPTCEVGTYDPDQNQCYQGDTTCPYGPDYPCVIVSGISQCSQHECSAFNPGDIEDSDTTQGQNDKQDDGTYDDQGNCLGTLYIFNGKDNRCRLAGLQTGWSNCCNGGDTWFGLGRCKGEEEQLWQMRQEGLCHYVGSYCSKKIPLIGCVQKKETYCCFNSKLGRILQEQGRPTLKSFPGGAWGDPESPNCRGFTPEEFQMLDFDRIDLSEWYGDIVPRSQEEVVNGMQNKIENFYNNLQ